MQASPRVLYHLLINISKHPYNNFSENKININLFHTLSLIFIYQFQILFLSLGIIVDQNFIIILKIMRRRGKKITLQEENLRSQLTEMSQIGSPKKIGKQYQDISPKKQKKQSKDKKPAPWPIYRKFFKYSLRRWKFGLLCILLTVSSGVISTLYPWKLGLLLDLVTKQTDNNTNPDEFRQKLIDSMKQLALLAVAIAIGNFFRFISLKVYQQKIGVDLRTQIYSIFIKNDLNFFQIYKTGQLISRLGNDINQAKSAISNNLTFLLRNVVTIIGTLVMLFMMSWKLTFIVLIVVPIYAFVTQQYTRKAKQLTRKRQDIEAEISVHVGEKFGGIQIIKAYCAQQQEIEKYIKCNMQSYKISKLRNLYQGIHNVCSSFLPSFASLLVLLYAGARLLSNNPQLSAGQLTSFILYCSNLTSTTAGISNSYTNIINGTSAIQKVFQMMHYQRLVVEDVGKEIEIDGSVKFDSVHFKYPQGESSLFGGLSFQIKPGEYIAFVGQSGSGKSTITKLIQHFYRVQAGRILFGQQNTQQINVKSLRSQIGLVSQQATIFSGTIQQNIAYGLKDYSLIDIQKAAQKSGCLDFLNNKVLFPNGFQTVIGERGVNLSGGQRQRISIARALMRKPKILIFDQATSSLDSNSEHIVQQSIQQLANDRGITIIVVAHRLSTVIKCDRLYVMKQGEIVQVGSHKQLLKLNGYYYNLIQKQLHGGSLDKQTKQTIQPNMETNSSPEIGQKKRKMKPQRNSQQISNS